MLRSVSAEPPIAESASFLTSSRSRMPRRSQMAKKRPPLALFGALSIADVDRGRVVIACRQRRADTGVHAATQEDNRALCVSSP